MMLSLPIVMAVRESERVSCTLSFQCPRKSPWSAITRKWKNAPNQPEGRAVLYLPSFLLLRHLPCPHPTGVAWLLDYAGRVGVGVTLDFPV